MNAVRYTIVILTLSSLLNATVQGFIKRLNTSVSTIVELRYGDYVCMYNTLSKEVRCTALDSDNNKALQWLADAIYVISDEQDTDTTNYDLLGTYEHNDTVYSVYQKKSGYTTNQSTQDIAKTLYLE